MQESPFLHGRDDVFYKLKNIPFLDALGTDHVWQVLSFSKLRVYENGEMITEEEVPDTWLYLLVSGEVTISKRGRELLRLHHAGEAFGEISFLDGSVRSATVTATGRTVCLAINADMISRIPLQYRASCFATLYRMLAEIIAQRLRRTSSELHYVIAENRDLKHQLANLQP